MLSSLSTDSGVEGAAYPRGPRQSLWPTLMVIDPDAGTTSRIVCYFEKRGFHVAAGATFAEARDLFFRCKTWSYIVADHHLPDATGAELLDWVRGQGCDAPVLLMSANPHYDARLADFDFLAKPFTMESLEKIVCRPRQPKT